MSDLPETARPRLYLDVDGVIIAEASPFETASLLYLSEKYAPEIIRRLGNTCMDLVWLTTRENQAIELAESVDGLRGGRVLSLDRSSRSSPVTWKLRALLSDQAGSPSPFVWVDDHITPEARREVAERLSVPKLVVQTDGNTGLNEPQLASIEQFAKTYVN